MTDSAYKMSPEFEAGPPLMVSVTAPSTLPAGYTLEAYVNDDNTRPFTCEVPEGGVKEGETFMVPLPPSTGNEIINAPTGRWKDGLFDCFSVGICHSSLCCALWCSRIAMAQIMTRLSLTWLGVPGHRITTQDTFKVVVLLVGAYAIYDTALEIASLDYTEDTMPPYITIMKSVGGSLFSSGPSTACARPARASAASTRSPRSGAWAARTCAARCGAPAAPSARWPATRASTRRTPESAARRRGTLRGPPLPSSAVAGGRRAPEGRHQGSCAPKRTAGRSTLWRSRKRTRKRTRKPSKHKQYGNPSVQKARSH
eukprot:CAMPEP_0197182404 /NCGR_PEP_ID=MMETSP1423-20130617/6368_1 /TAXON_ID=476441 /ORGANISM="Pseudo-nitzschia heimii, Strain UNC1101" /LENGTH=312 /DNA_ID=CAMNT_0042632821 /DNA_START=150 /DNA_END=1089 /DNA_ORIENTATION=+